MPIATCAMRQRGVWLKPRGGLTCESINTRADCTKYYATSRPHNNTINTTRGLRFSLSHAKAAATSRQRPRFRGYRHRHTCERMQVSDVAVAPVCLKCCMQQSLCFESYDLYRMPVQYIVQWRGQDIDHCQYLAGFGSFILTAKMYPTF